MPNNTGQIWTQAAAGAAQGGIALGLQRLGINYDYRKQREQQDKLMQMQLGYEDRLMAIQNKRQLEMWEATGYGAQKDQMKRAGINPALMYGMGGGGGQTVGGSMPSVNAGTAGDPNTRGALGMGLMQGAQLALLNAQKENIEADTANKQASSKNLGAGTEKTTTENNLLKLEENMKTYMYEANEKGEHQEGDLKNTVEGKRRIAEMKLQIEQGVTQEVETRLKEKGIKLEQAQIDKMSADIVQRWSEIANETKSIEQQGRQVDINEAQQKLNKMLADWNTDWGNIVGKEAVDAVSSVIQVIGLGRILKGKERTVVQGFGGKRSY